MAFSHLNEQNLRSVFSFEIGIVFYYNNNSYFEYLRLKKRTGIIFFKKVFICSPSYIGLKTRIKERNLSGSFFSL